MGVESIKPSESDYLFLTWGGCATEPWEEEKSSPEVPSCQLAAMLNTFSKRFSNGFLWGYRHRWVHGDFSRGTDL